jgi:hypothetical protein
LSGRRSSKPNVMAKEEYFECDAEGIGHTLNAVAADDHRPLAPQPPGPNAGAPDLREYQKAQSVFRSEQRTWLTHHQKALGYIRKSLAFGSKPFQELEKIVATPPPPVNGVPAPWGADLILRAVLNHMQANYAPADSTDLSTYRFKMAEMRDTEGFYKYAEDFVRYHTALVQACDPPTDLQCTDWVKNGIVNPMVKNFMATNLFALGQQPPPFTTIFAAIRNYLKILGDIDPYKSCNDGPSSKPLTALTALKKGQGKVDRCTICWRSGHTYSKCHANNCSICNTKLESKTVKQKTCKFCPNWANHKEENTAWIPFFLRDKTQATVSNKDGNVSSPAQTVNGNNPATDSISDRKKAAQKALRAILQEEKKSKKQK